MKKSGGIVAIIAGIFGVLAAIATLMVGGIGAGLDADGADTVLMLGIAGVAFSFLTIVFGAIAMSAVSRWPGVFLVLCAFGGAALGGTLVALFMALALLGGLLALFGKNQATATIDT